MPYDDPNAGGPNPDEGARLHAEKNAPWVSGIYTHLHFPPYQFRAYPKMLYHPSYGEARAAMDKAIRIPARGTEDGARAQAMMEAQRALDESMRIVQTEDEAAALAGAWFDTPQAAAAAKEQWAQEIAAAAAHAAYEDRRLGPQAKAERQAADAAAEDHLVEIPEQPRTRRQTDADRLAVGQRLKAARAAKRAERGR